MSQINNIAASQNTSDGASSTSNSFLKKLFSRVDAANLAPLPSRKWVIVLAIASLIAISASGYLAYVALTSSKVAGCGGGRLFNCGHVISSRWSLWMGIPVSLMAIGLYIGLVSSLFIGASKKFSNSLRHIGWAITSVFAVAAGLSAIWFISLQIFVLNHLCTYCLVAHACGLVAASVVLWLRPIGIAGMKTISIASISAVAVLIGGQLLTEPPKTYRIEEYEAPAASEVEVFEFEAPVASLATEPAATTASIRFPSVHQLGQTVATLLSPATSLNHQVTQSKSQSKTNQKTTQSTSANTTEPIAKQAKRRMVPINGGTVQLDVAQWPIAGSTSAKYIFVEMFDYSCPHCRHTHAAIKTAKEQLGGNLAVVVLPIPLNTACNSGIQVTDPKFIESCEISKLAVAVWRVDPAKFTEFHNWMLVDEEAPTYAIAKAQADTLVDVDKLNAEIASGVPAQYLAKTVELYKRAGSGNVPKLIFPTTSIVGEFTSAKSLVEVIKQQIK